MFAAYATVPVYEAFFRALGWGEAIDPMVAAWREGDRKAAVGQALPVGAGADAVSALLNLGFRPAEAATAVAAAEDELGPSASLDALVRTALKKAAKG